MDHKIDFIRKEFIPLLRNADHTTMPRWGKMSFQHMVEHLVLSFKNANGKIKTPQVFTPADRLPASRQWLATEKEFRENTKSPSFPEEPMPLHFKTVKEGIDKLEKEIADFFLVYQNSPGLTVTNPVFGDLNYEEAIQLLYKHCQHHSKQFGLIA
jgi:hypothetical protein